MIHMKKAELLLVVHRIDPCLLSSEKHEHIAVTHDELLLLADIISYKILQAREDNKDFAIITYAYFLSDGVRDKFRSFFGVELGASRLAFMFSILHREKIVLREVRYADDKHMYLGPVSHFYFGPEHPHFMDVKRIERIEQDHIDAPENDLDFFLYL